MLNKRESRRPINIDKHTVVRRLGKLKLSSAVLLLVVIIFGVLVAFVVGLATSMSRHTANDPYCTTVDPTGCIIETRIDNDTGLTYTVKQCKDSDIPCKTFADVAKLGPGDGRTANGSTDGTPQVWIIVDQQGTVAGCLNLEFTKDQPTPVTVPLSKMQSCRNVSNTMTEFKKKYHVF